MTNSAQKVVPMRNPTEYNYKTIDSYYNFTMNLSMRGYIYVMFIYPEKKMCSRVCIFQILYT